MVNFGWINDDVGGTFDGFNGVNADDAGWNALGIDGGRMGGWISGDGRWETDVGGWSSGFCWKTNGELFVGVWDTLIGAGNNGLNGVFVAPPNRARQAILF